METNFNETQVLVIEDTLAKEEVLEKMANVLKEKGFVKDSYLSAILEREKIYPTGLENESIHVAIPHCDIANVNHAALCVGVLKQPIKFAKMDDPDTNIDVSLIIMMALTEPHGHIEMLQKIIALIQDQELLEKVITATEPSVVYDLTKDKLL
ncbi:PTS sugar transporter subunit IIA [Anaerorhabdus sp.]|uniref:PTS sugar transporter subunit IIA n=1 Tax=Anaerorhabdus sp. TaxID=1872524 RepID=UPI002B1F3BEA|nr:PTS sugar transporter subunit IIA [Anaerorhabdus sp.]MEA4873939.1 PTS sugar transporter subunit IIA [Anaerorhabdus sp.]